VTGAYAANLDGGEIAVFHITKAETCRSHSDNYSHRAPRAADQDSSDQVAHTGEAFLAGGFGRDHLGSPIFWFRYFLRSPYSGEGGVDFRSHAGGCEAVLTDGLFKTIKLPVVCAVLAGAFALITPTGTFPVWTLALGTGLALTLAIAVPLQFLRASR
jgi:hypothetical protein